MSETFESGTRKDSASGGNGWAHADGSRSGSTRDRLRGFANAQKDAGIEHVTSFADAAHKAADSLAEKNSGIAGLVHEAADALDRTAKNLRDQDVSDIYGSLHRFAKQQPLVFFAGSFAAGVLLSRFLKSSAASEQTEQQPYHPSPSL